MKLSSGTIEEIKPIIDQIDNELKKDQDERITFQIITNRVPSLKTALATYKSLFRREEWNGKFWMHKKKNKETGEAYLEINFSPRERMNFSIQQIGVVKNTDTEFTIIANNDAPNPGDGPALEMNDSQVSVYILTEQPRAAQFLISCLTDATKEYLKDVKNNEKSALMNLLERNGYRCSVVMDTRLRIYK